MFEKKNSSTTPVAVVHTSSTRSATQSKHKSAQKKENHSTRDVCQMTLKPRSQTTRAVTRLLFDSQHRPRQLPLHRPSRYLHPLQKFIKDTHNKTRQHARRVHITRPEKLHHPEHKVATTSVQTDLTSAVLAMQPDTLSQHIVLTQQQQQQHNQKTPEPELTKQTTDATTSTTDIQDATTHAQLSEHARQLLEQDQPLLIGTSTDRLTEDHPFVTLLTGHLQKAYAIGNLINIAQDSRQEITNIEIEAFQVIQNRIFMAVEDIITQLKAIPEIAELLPVYRFDSYEQDAYRKSINKLIQDNLRLHYLYPENYELGYYQTHVHDILVQHIPRLGYYEKTLSQKLAGHIAQHLNNNLLDIIDTVYKDIEHYLQQYKEDQKVTVQNYLPNVNTISELTVNAIEMLSSEEHTTLNLKQLLLEQYQIEAIANTLKKIKEE